MCVCVCVCVCVCECVLGRKESNQTKQTNKLMYRWFIFGTMIYFYLFIQYLKEGVALIGGVMIDYKKLVHVEDYLCIVSLIP